MAKIISMKLKNVETRNDWYHFRLNVPKDLQDRIGKKVIKKSLETQDDLVAQRLADRLSQEWKAEFKAMRSDNPERNKSIDERIDTMRRAMRPPLDNFVENCCKHPDPEIERTLEDLEIEHDWIVEKQWWQVSVMGLYEDLRTATNKQEDPRMVRRVIRLYREMLNHCYAGLKEELGVAIDIPFRAPTWKAEGQDRAESQSSGYSKSKSTLSDCLKEILDDGKQREGRTILSLKSDVALFEEFHGVKPVGQYTLQDIISFRDDCLRKVTVNGHKLFPNLSLKQLIELPEGTLSANGKEAKKPSINTVKNRLRSIRQVFLHAKDTGKITVNPCATVKDIQQEANKVGKQSSKQEKAFTPEQIKEIMRASKAENGKTHPARRWATQLIVHLGMRANECLQLRASQIDVDTAGGAIDLEVIDPKTQHLKNAESIRHLPIPSVMLKDEEFKAYVRERKSIQGDAPLWTDLTHAKNTRWLRKWSRWFNDLECVGKDQNAHGMRHSAVTRGRVKRLNISEIQRIIGHSDGSGMTDTYTNREEMRKALRETVDGMAFAEE